MIKGESVYNESLDKMMEFSDVPGIVLATLKEGEIFVGARGYSDYYAKLPMAEDTVFHCTSIAKLFTATAVMVLERQGRLMLEDKVASVIPDLTITDKRWEDITIAQIMSHTSGIRDVYDYQWQLCMSEDEALSRYLKSDEIKKIRLLFNPGEGFRYSNIGYSILGLLIERLSEMRFEEFIRKEIFKPIGMKDTTLLTLERTGGSLDFEALHKANMAVAHSKDCNRNIVREEIYPYSRNHAPSSCLTSTGRDLMIWARAVIDGELVDFERMFSPRMVVPGSKEKVGLGWFIRESKGRRLVGHEGGDRGFRNNFWICVEEEAAAAWLCNLTGAPIKSIL